MVGSINITDGKDQLTDFYINNNVPSFLITYLLGTVNCTTETEVIL